MFFVGNHAATNIVFEIRSPYFADVRIGFIFEKPQSMRLFSLSLAVTLAFLGCTRTPVRADHHRHGQRGTRATHCHHEPANAVVVPAADEDVFITYGDRVGPDDRVQTNFDGEFAFYGLRPGAYTVYVYSEDTLPPFNNSPDIAIVRQFEIEAGDEAVDIGALRIYKDI